MNYLCKLSHSVVDCAVHILTGNGEVVGGPIMARGDHLQCHGWSRGTTFGGGPLLGGNICSMTAFMSVVYARISPEAISIRCVYFCTVSEQPAVDGQSVAAVTNKN